MAAFQSIAGQATNYVIVENGPNHRVWEKITYSTGPQGEQQPHLHKYTELNTGVNYKNAQGQWTPAQEIIQAQTNGTAAAVQGNHQLYFPPDIYQGYIENVTSDGKHLKSRPTAIYYFDGTNSVMLGQLTNSTGQILNPGNQVLYADAFTDISADVLCTYRKSGFESDLIFRSALPTPAQLGLNQATTRLVLYTEFFGTNEPIQIPLAFNAKDGLADTKLDFGHAKMIRGKAFFTGPELNQPDTANSRLKKKMQHVYKSWIHAQGRTFLIEEVPYKGVSAALESLQNTGKNGVPLPKYVLFKGSPQLPKNDVAKVQPDHPAIKASNKSIAHLPGFVLDYIQPDMTEGDYTFQSDTTYFITGSRVYIEGTATIEGGAVIKFDTGNYTLIEFDGSIICPTNTYRPAVITTSDDNAEGENFEGSSGNPEGYGTTYFDLEGSGNALLTNLRFCYGLNAVYPGVLPLLTVQDCQFINSSFSIALYGTGCDVHLYNVLFGADANAIDVAGANPNIVAENVTVDESASDYTFLTWDSDGGVPVSISLTNCLVYDGGGTLSGISSLLTSEGGTYSSAATFETTSDPFQIVGGGGYYLAADSPYQSAGTTNIDSDLLADLQTKTTYPPIAFTNVTFTNVMTFSPQAQRDPCSPPDVGYHYDPLDFIFGGCTAQSNINFTAGTAVGWFRTSSGWYHAGYGIVLSNQQICTFSGTVTAPCHWDRINLVQENDLTGGYGPGGMEGWADQYLRDVSLSPEIHATFLKGGTFGGETCSIFRDDWGYLIVRALSSEFHSSTIGGYIISMYFTNCLFDRCYIGQVEGSSGNEVHMINCTQNNAATDLTAYNYPVNFVVENCAFDNSQISTSGYGSESSYDHYDYNAYLAGANQLSPEGSHSFTVDSSFNWQPGPLGCFYQATNSLLINSGNTNANLLGLYHYTTQTNEVKETNSLVDVGYHYVALNSGGLPDDSSGDGIPDYLKDSNGDGVYESAIDLGNWQTSSTCGDGTSDHIKYLEGRNLNVCTSYTDTNGILFLQVYTPLK